MHLYKCIHLYATLHTHIYRYVGNDDRQLDGTFGYDNVNYTHFLAPDKVSGWVSCVVCGVYSWSMFVVSTALICMFIPYAAAYHIKIVSSYSLRCVPVCIGVAGERGLQLSGSHVR